MDKDAMIRGAILAMEIENDKKTELLKYLDELQDDSLKLLAFVNSGVDNWEYYDEAIDLYEKYNEGE